MRTTTAEEAVALIPDGASLMVGGFMGVGTPERVIDELIHQRRRGLTIIANDTALPGVGIGKLVTAGALRKVVASHIGLNPETTDRCSPRTKGIGPARRSSCDLRKRPECRVE